MKRSRIPLSIALTALGLLLVVYYGANLASASVWDVFSKTAGLAAARSLAFAAALVTTGCLLVAGAMIAVPTALVPARFAHRLLNVLPLYTLGLTLAALVANGVGIGTLGTILSTSSAFKLSLAAAWLITSAALAILVVGIAAVRATITPRALRAAIVWVAVAAVPAVVLVAAMLYSINLVGASQSSLPVTGASEPGGMAGRVSLLRTATSAMAVIGVIALAAVALTANPLRRPRMAAAGEGMARERIDYRREVVQVLLACAAITILLSAAIQFVPVSRPPNSPPQGTLNWDSPQTEQLVRRACMNCHSNQTEWPLYASFAPASWMTVVHVTSARAQFNLSELTNLSSPRKVRLARDMIDQIRSGVMPPPDYLLLHPEARLDAAEKEQLIQGLQNSLK